MPTLEIEGRDVEVDDAFLSMSPDEQNKAVEEIAGSLNLMPAASAAPKPELRPVPPSDTFGGAAMNATAGVNEGLYGTLGAPVDLMRGAMNLGIKSINSVTGSAIDAIPENSFGGSRFLAETLGAAAPQLDPQNTVAATPGERIARGVGQGVGYAVAPEAAVAGLAKAGTITPKLAETAGKIVGRGESAGAVATNAAIGGVSGAGAQAAMEATPDAYDPVSGTLGGLAATVPATLAAGIPGLVRTGGRMIGDYLAPVTQAGREQLAANRLRAGASDIDAVKETLDNLPADLVPGSAPTTGQVTGDLGLLGLERGAAVKRPEAFSQRRADQNEARVAALGGIQPEGAPETVVAAIRNRVADIDREAESIVSRAREGARTSATGLGPGQTPDTAGASLRTSLETARARAKEQERALWNAVDPDGTLALPTTGTRQAAIDLVKTSPKSAKPIAGEEAAILSTAGNFGDTMPLSEMTALSSRLKAEMRAERQLNGETPAYARMAKLSSAIHSDLDGAVLQKARQEADAATAGAILPEQTMQARLEAVDAPKTAKRVYTPSGRSFPVDYDIVEADDLIRSNLPDGRPDPRYPAALQPRDRTRAASETQIAGMARDLQPHRLGASAEAGTGAPIIGPDGVVESGNGRLAAISRAYDERGPSATGYRDYLASEGYDVGAMRKPVLVRRRVGSMSDEERARLAQESNASQSLAMSASEQAATDASRLTPDILARYRGGDITSADNREFARSFLGAVADKGQEGSFVTGAGTLSVDGAGRMRNALLSAAYGDQKLIAALADEGDENIRAFGRSLSDVSGDIARLQAGIKGGAVHAGADLAPAFVDAARVVQKARSSNMRLADAVSQADAFNPISPEALDVLRIGYGDGLSGRLSREKLSGIMREAVSEAEKQSADARLFGEALDARTILAGARQRYAEQTGRPTGSSPGRVGVVADPAGDGASGPAGRGSGPLSVGPEAAGSMGGGTLLGRPALTPNFDDDALGRLNAARASTRERVATFDNPTLRPLRQRPATSAPYAVSDSAVPARIFAPGARSFDAIQSYRQAVGDAAALPALRDYAVDRLRKVALREDGTFDPARLDAFRRSHADALRAVPELDRSIADAGRAAETLGTVVRQREQVLSEAQKGTLGRIMQLDDPSDVTRTVGSIFNRQDAVQQMVRLRGPVRGQVRGSAEAEQGLRKAVVDHIRSRFVGNTEAGTSGVGTVKSDGFQTFVKQSEPALRAAGFTDYEVRTLQLVADDLQRANRSVAAVKNPGGSDTAQNLYAAGAGDGPTSIMQRLLANAPAAAGAAGGFTMGGAGGAFMGAVGAKTLADMRMAGLNSVDDMVTDALLNPGRARVLIAKVRTPAEEEGALKVLGRMYRKAGATAAAIGTTEGDAPYSGLDVTIPSGGRQAAGGR